MFAPMGIRWLTVATTLSVACALVAAPASAVEARSPLEGSPRGLDPYLSPQGNGGYNISHYDVDLTYDAKTHGIAAAEVQIEATADQGLRQFSLDARKGLDIKYVSVRGNPTDFRHSGDKLIVATKRTIQSGSRFTVVVHYSGEPRPVQDTSGRGKYGWLRTTNGSVTYTEPTGTSTWLPSNDVFYDKATWQMRLTAPKGLLGVSTGTFQGIDRRGSNTISSWRMNTPIQPYIQVVAFDRFAYSTDPISGIPAFTAVALRAGVTVGTMRRRTAAALRWLVPRLGKYPFQSTGAIVVDGANSAMETAGRPTYSSGAWNTSRATVLHEQAHQWFGNTITAHNASDIWLHEGFATYLENVETAERTSRALGDIVHEQYVWDGWGAPWRGQFGRVSLHEPTMKYLLNTTPYYRGQAALHALRHEVGDAAFWRIMRDLALEPAGRTSSTAEIISRAEESSAQDLSGWADKWVYSVDAQRLPEPPTHGAVVTQMGPYLLDAASDFVWDPRGRPLAAMSRAEKSWTPLDQLDVTDVAVVKHGSQVRYFVDFETRVGLFFPEQYKSCLVFDRKDDKILAGSFLGVRISDSFEPNKFTLRACEPR